MYYAKKIRNLNLRTTAKYGLAMSLLKIYFDTAFLHTIGWSGFAGTFFLINFVHIYLYSYLYNFRSCRISWFFGSFIIILWYCKFQQSEYLRNCRWSRKSVPWSDSTNPWKRTLKNKNFKKSRIFSAKWRNLRISDKFWHRWYYRTYSILLFLQQMKL